MVLKEFAFKQPFLLNGINYISVMIGAFAIAEVYRNVEELSKRDTSTVTNSKVSLVIMKFSEMLKMWKTFVKSAIIGTLSVYSSSWRINLIIDFIRRSSTNLVIPLKNLVKVNLKGSSRQNQQTMLLLGAVWCRRWCLYTREPCGSSYNGRFYDFGDLDRVHYSLEINPSY